MFFPFGSGSRPVRPANTWFFAGLCSNFPDIQPTETDEEVVKSIAASGACAGAESVSGCKVFHVSEEYGPSGPTVVERTAGTASEDVSMLKGEVLVFQYKGKFHAVDHKCPHSSFPLSDAHLFDIEDFGIVLSAGLTCPKHGWSFDIFTGLGDRGNYRLKIWEVELRDIAKDRPTYKNSQDEGDKEVWVRRKPRIG